MVRKSALIFSLVSAALTVPGLAGCTASFQAGGGAEEPPPPPPPAPAPAPAPEPAAEAPKPKLSTATVKGDSVAIPGNIVFDTGKSTLQEGPARAESEKVLEQLKLFLDENPQVTKLRIEGHTDNVGKPEDNLVLGGQRALTIKKWLVDKGVKPERVLAAGFGEQKPIADNSTDQGRAQNRRTEFKIAELNGKKYLGMDPTGGGKVYE
jgi:OOP family OmpA-OmpF porin